MMVHAVRAEARPGAALPRPRGPLSAAVTNILSEHVHAFRGISIPPVDALEEDDFQLALYVLYELHYRSFDGVDDRWEWEPSLLRLRRQMEDAFDAALRDAVDQPSANGAPIGRTLQTLVEGASDPGLPDFMRDHASLDQFRELLAHRSPYQLKEADPHTWAIPRLPRPAKAALVEIQADEYGGGRLDQMHAQIFDEMMRALGMDATPSAYVDQLPGISLANVNLVTRFGLHRARRGATAGHLAIFEMTSPRSARGCAEGLRRLLGPDAPAHFYDIHVVADAVHEQIAAYDLAGGLAADEPELVQDILFGAAACLELDRRFGEYLLARWSAGRSSLSARP